MSRHAEAGLNYIILAKSVLCRFGNTSACLLCAQVSRGSGTELLITLRMPRCIEHVLVSYLFVGLPAGLAAATEQLPVVGDGKAQSEAQLLLDACQAAQADTWALPLALILEDVNCLAGASTHPMASCHPGRLLF